MHKRSLPLLLLSLIVLFSVPVRPAAAENQILRISGAVQSPIHLTIADMQRFKQKDISAYQDTRSKENTAGRYGAIPLKSLLELSKIQVPIQSLAVSIKNDQGEQIVLSGGEIFLTARNRIFIAASADGSEKLRQHLPALVQENSGRVCLTLNRINSIEAISLAQFTPDSSNLRKVALPIPLTGRLIETGAARGYGLRTVLDQIAAKTERSDVLRISARDGNSVVVSSEELNSDPGPLVVPRQNEGKYGAVFPGDKETARAVADIDFIEIISLKQKPMIYVVGIGCGDPNLLTNEAISIMAKADAFVGKDDFQETLAGYIAGRPVLFDPFMQLGRYQKTKHPELTDPEAEKLANTVYADNIQMLRKSLADGKIVALLEPGDPTLYGGWRNWLSEYIPASQIRVVAGMSAFSVANTVLGEYDLTKNPVLIAEPEQLRANEQLVQTAAERGSLVVVFMGLNRMKSLVPLLGKHFAPETPVNIVYYAGIAGKEHRIQTNLSKAIETADAEKENFLGLIYVGRDLQRSAPPAK
jgi:precorrin-2 methylase